MSPARRTVSAASSVGTISGAGAEQSGLSHSVPLLSPRPHAVLDRRWGGFLEVVQVSEVTDVEASQFHLSLSPTGQPGRHTRGRVRHHRTRGVPVWLCVHVCGMCGCMCAVMCVVVYVCGVWCVYVFGEYVAICCGMCVCSCLCSCICV